MQFKGLALVVLSSGLVACSGGSSSPTSAKPPICASPETAPLGLSPTEPQALAIFNKISGGCVVVDGQRLSMANVAIAINATFVAESHDLESQSGGSAAPTTIPAITSDDWLRYGVATAVGHELAQLEAAAKHISVEAEGEQVRASGVAPAAWFAGQLKKHDVQISGFDVAIAAADLPQFVLPPGCKSLPTGGC